MIQEDQLEVCIVYKITCVLIGCEDIQVGKYILGSWNTSRIVVLINLVCLL